MKTVTRMVTVERGGKVHTVPQEIPVPRDWDAIALGAVRTAASLAVAGAVTWSTVAIGGLLAGFAPVWAAYLVAGVFDLAWIVCMVLEWLSRYDRSRARLPIVFGWVFLGVSVALISLHGYQGGVLALGVCGGAVSAIAKCIWAVVMRHTAVPMDPASQAWLEAERADVNSRLAVTAGRRQLARTEARTTAEALALSAGQPDMWTAEVVPVPSPETVPVLDSPVSRDSGQDSVSVPETVPVPRTTPDNRAADLSGRLSQRAFVRGLLSADPSLSNTDLSAAVLSEYGPDTKTDSIKKAIQRARGDLSQTA